MKEKLIEQLQPIADKYFSHDEVLPANLRKPTISKII